MNRFESKYFNTSLMFDEALLRLLQDKDIEYITVKDICLKAGFNRSTFYLHYESIQDVLRECIENINKSFYERFDHLKGAFTMKTDNLNDLILIKAEYLMPYLEYIKDNQIVLKAYIDNASLFNSGFIYEDLFKNIFNPILIKFGSNEKANKYIMLYYLNGITAIIMEWVSNKCDDDTNYIIDLIIKCVLPKTEQNK